MTTSTINKVLLYGGAILSFILIWAYIAYRVGSELILPTPILVIRAFSLLISSSSFYRDILVTLCRGLCAFALSLIFGVSLGWLCSLSYVVRVFTGIPLWLARSTPVVSLIMVVLFWLPARSLPIFSAVLMALPLIYQASLNGIANVDGSLLYMARVYRLTAMQTLLYIRLPIFMSYMKGAALSAYSLIWKVVAAGEVLALPKEGLGAKLYMAQVHLDSSAVLAYTLCIVALGAITSTIFTLVLRLLAKKASLLLYSIFSIVPCRKVYNSAPYKIDIRDATIARGTKVVYSALTLTIAKGEQVALMGESGIGKTTLLDYIASTVVSSSTASLGYVFQQPRLIGYLSVQTNVQLVLAAYGIKDSLCIARRAIREVGLSGLEQRICSTLSGGEAQRVNLARALALNPSILLLDEGFKGLNRELKMLIYKKVKERVANNACTLILATHDITEAHYFTTRILRLCGRPIVIKDTKCIKGI